MNRRNSPDYDDYDDRYEEVDELEDQADDEVQNEAGIWVPGMKKKPSTSELLDWIKLLMVDDITPEALRSKDMKTLIPPLHGALLKNEHDVHLFERLAFLNRSEERS